MEPTYTPAEVAAMEKVSAYTITLACREGRIPGAYRTSGNTGWWRIPESAVLAYRKRHAVQVADPDRIEPRSPRDRQRARKTA